MDPVSGSPLTTPSDMLFYPQPLQALVTATYQGRHEGGAGDTGNLVHNRLFHVALNSLQHGALWWESAGSDVEAMGCRAKQAFQKLLLRRPHPAPPPDSDSYRQPRVRSELGKQVEGGRTHISDLAEGSDSRTTVIILFPSHVFCQAAGERRHCWHVGVIGLPSSLVHTTPGMDYHTSLLATAPFCSQPSKPNSSSREFYRTQNRARHNGTGLQSRHSGGKGRQEDHQPELQLVSSSFPSIRQQLLGELLSSAGLFPATAQPAPHSFRIHISLESLSGPKSSCCVKELWQAWSFSSIPSALLKAIRSHS